MLAKFQRKKQDILDSLRKPPDDYEDFSPKGALDDEIRELVAEINTLPGYVTTSSCAGRVVVYLEGEAKTPRVPNAPEDELVSATASSSSSSSSKGGNGGKWLFSSHSPIDLSALTAPGALFAHLGFPRTAEPTYPSPPSPPGQDPPTAAVRFIHLKFEPLILHVLAQSPEHAQTLLSAALTAGFRESGISGVGDVVDGKARAAAPPMVAVRSAGLSMDCLVGFLPPPLPPAAPPTTSPSTPPPQQQQRQQRQEEYHSMVSEDYLRTALGVANARFALNVERRERFHRALRARAAGDDGAPSDDRRRRRAEKRAEDVRRGDEARARRAAALQSGGALDGMDGDGDGVGDDGALEGLWGGEEDPWETNGC